jgi:hypothetical protein
LNETNSTPDSLTTLPRDYLLSLAAWLVPGSGHFLLKQWGRAAVFFFCVGGLAVTGYALRGHLYSPQGEDIFGLLGYLAQIGAGGFYFLARILEPHGPDVARSAGDFGTRFLAAAGLLNFLCILDVWEIAHHRKS